MATPQGAKHRDLEQRLRDNEQQVRQLTAAALKQRQLSVEQGDFHVSGGGNIVVDDGGNINVTGGDITTQGGSIVAKYSDGSDGIQFGDIFDINQGYTGLGLLVQDNEGNAMLACYQRDVDAGRRLRLSCGFSGSALWLDDTEASFTNGHGDYLNLTDQYVILNGSGKKVWLTGSSIRLQGTPTTSASANLFSNANNDIFKVSSSRRYKQDVQPAEVDPEAVLRLEGVTWRDRLEVEQDPDTDTRYVGFIAEDMEAAGLGQFVVYEDGRPESIAYDRLAVALLALAKHQQQRLDQLEDRLAALEAAHAHPRDHDDDTTRNHDG